VNSKKILFESFQEDSDRKGRFPQMDNSDEKVSISSTFYAQLVCQYFCTKKLHSQYLTREKLRKALLYKKVFCKTLMKLTTGEGKDREGTNTEQRRKNCETD